MAFNQLSILLHEIVKGKMSVEPFAPVIKRINQARLANLDLDLDNLHLKAMQKTTPDYHFMELFPCPIIVIDQDCDVVFANSSALSWIGRNYNEVVGEFIADLMADRRHIKHKDQFLSPIIEVWSKQKECYLEECYITTLLLTIPIPVEISTKTINFNGKNYFGIIILNRFAAGSFDAEIMRMYSEILAESPETLTYFSKYISGLDVYTRGHCKQVAEYATLLGLEIGLSSKELEALYTTCMLHDIGNLAVSPTVLQKKGKLTPLEMQQIQIHPVAGADILEEILVFRDLASYVRHHHEWYDGTGYPDGLKGTEIPLLSRIIAIADAFDAMTSYRPYRQKMNLEQVRAELLKNAGKQFDPNLVDVVIYLIDIGKLKPLRYCAVTEQAR